MTRPIGLIPAGGKAARLHGLPKFLLPLDQDYLLVRLQRIMGVECFIGTNPDTHDLVSQFAGHPSLVRCLHSVSYVDMLVKAYGQVKGRAAFFGMPDTYFEDIDIYMKLQKELHSGADVAVGVFEARPEQRHKLGMCVTSNGKLLHVKDKPEYTNLTLAWGVMAWNPVFWHYISAGDAHLGDSLNAAIGGGLVVRAVRMRGQYWDCGTFDEYADLCSKLVNKAVNYGSA